MAPQTETQRDFDENDVAWNTREQAIWQGLAWGRTTHAIVTIHRRSCLRGTTRRHRRCTCDPIVVHTLNKSLAEIVREVNRADLH